MRDIKRRKDSIQSTGQITKAMKLVSTVKLQKAKGRAENTKPYFDLMYETVQSILAKSGHINHKYLKESESDKKAVIVVTANRGLAGGYNSNITRMIIDEGFTKENTVVYAVEVDFIRHLRIFPFSLSEEGEFEAREYRTGRQERYRVRYVTHPDFVLTWIIK